jgi:hypothetical protein
VSYGFSYMELEAAYITALESEDPSSWLTGGDFRPKYAWTNLNGLGRLLKAMGSKETSEEGLNRLLGEGRALWDDDSGIITLIGVD